MNRRSNRGAYSKPFVSGGSLYTDKTKNQVPAQCPEPPKLAQVSASPSPVKADVAANEPSATVTKAVAAAKPVTDAAAVEPAPMAPKPVKVAVVADEEMQQEEVSESQDHMDAQSEHCTIESDEGGESGSTKGFMRRLMKNRKKPSVRAKEKKIRQSRLIRRILIPKNALMALHEVKNIKIEDFQITSNPSGGFQAVVSINNIQYEGIGNSKNAAKSNVCEKALRDLVLAKMSRPSRPSDDNSTKQPTSLPKEDMEMKDVSEENEEDDVPILNLASFALFKLFSEWEAEGFEVPEFRPSHPNGTVPEAAAEKQEKPKKQPTVRVELPPGWETMHPATLLCMMRPGLTYVDLGATGLAPNQTQKTGVTVDDQHFIGMGKSKKIARKNAAANACNSLFNTNFQNSLV